MAKAARKQKTAASIATRTISLRLLSKDRTVDDAVRTNRDLQEHATKTGRLFCSQSDDNTPPWLALVNQFTADGELRLRNKSCIAILVLDIESAGAAARTFALTFGGGHLAIHAYAFERNFELKVALNSIARANLKNLDVATLEATSFQNMPPALRKMPRREALSSTKRWAVDAQPSTRHCATQRSCTTMPKCCLEKVFSTV